MDMRILAIETASEACSVALFEGGERLAGVHEILGRGHAERLVPMISELPDKGRADRILVSLGPGSFTGVRIGLATARALGIAWNAEVLGYPTLALVAVMASQNTIDGVTVCMNGGHGQWFVQNFDARMHELGEVRSLTPEEAKSERRFETLVGNRASELAHQLGNSSLVLDFLPDASQVPLLDETSLTGSLSPIYGRPPDAKRPS